MPPPAQTQASRCPLPGRKLLLLHRLVKGLTWRHVGLVTCCTNPDMAVADRPICHSREGTIGLFHSESDALT